MEGTLGPLGARHPGVGASSWRELLPSLSKQSDVERPPGFGSSRALRIIPVWVVHRDPRWRVLGWNYPSQNFNHQRDPPTPIFYLQVKSTGFPKLIPFEMEKNRISNRAAEVGKVATQRCALRTGTSCPLHVRTSWSTPSSFPWSQHSLIHVLPT